MVVNARAHTHTNEHLALQLVLGAELLVFTASSRFSPDKSMISDIHSVTFCVLTYTWPFRLEQWLILWKSGLLALCPLFAVHKQTDNSTTLYYHLYSVPSFEKPQHGKTILHTVGYFRSSLLMSQFHINVQFVLNRTLYGVVCWQLFYKMLIIIWLLS